MDLEDEIVRGVFDPVDFLQHYIPFGFQVALPEERTANQIGEDLDGQGKIGIENMGLVAGVVAEPPARWERWS
jgi:hypothetical protein